MNDKETTVEYEGKYLKMLLRDTWEFVKRKNLTGIVGMIPVTDDNKLVLVEQYRPPLDKKVIELPAGLVGDTPEKVDELFETAATRELLEETGYEAKKMTKVFDGVASPGMTDESVTFYLATELTKIGPGGGDETEDITVHEVELPNLISWLEERKEEGMIIDLKVYSALYFVSETIKKRS